MIDFILCHESIFHLSGLSPALDYEYDEETKEIRYDLTITNDSPHDATYDIAVNISHETSRPECYNIAETTLAAGRSNTTSFIGHKVDLATRGSSVECRVVLQTSYGKMFAYLDIMTDSGSLSARNIRR